MAAILAFTASRSAPSRDRRVWLAIGAAMVMLGAAKLLRLQGALTDTLRAAAQAGGWYGLHREAQGLFAIIVGLLALAGAVFAARMLRRSKASVSVAAGALGALLVLLIVRAASIHVIDAWTTAEVAGDAARMVVRSRRGRWPAAARRPSMAFTSARASSVGP